jgi:hypothetical protein
MKYKPKYNILAYGSGEVGFRLTQDTKGHLFMAKL